MYAIRSYYVVEKWYAELENKYPGKRCHEMVVMPNHFHCIIENMGMGEMMTGGAMVGNGRCDGLMGRPRRGAPTWAP